MRTDVLSVSNGPLGPRARQDAARRRTDTPPGTGTWTTSTDRGTSRSAATAISRTWSSLGRCRRGDRQGTRRFPAGVLVQVGPHHASRVVRRRSQYGRLSLHKSGGCRANASLLIHGVAVLGPNKVRTVGRCDVDSSCWYSDGLAFVKGFTKANVNGAGEHSAHSFIRMNVRWNLCAVSELHTEYIGAGVLICPQHPRGLNARQIRRTDPPQALSEDRIRRNVLSHRNTGEDAASHQQNARWVPRSHSPIDWVMCKVTGPALPVN